MNICLTHQQLIKAIEELPSESLNELSSFIEYLRFKMNLNDSSHGVKAGVTSGSDFLLNIAGIGYSDENDISERDEEILTKEINHVHGWNLKERIIP